MDRLLGNGALKKSGIPSVVSVRHFVTEMRKVPHIASEVREKSGLNVQDF